MLSPFFIDQKIKKVISYSFYDEKKLAHSQSSLWCILYTEKVNGIHYIKLICNIILFVSNKHKKPHNHGGHWKSPHIKNRDKIMMKKWNKRSDNQFIEIQNVWFKNIKKRKA